MKLSTDQLRLIISGCKHEHICAKTGTENMGKEGSEAFRNRY